MNAFMPEDQKHLTAANSGELDFISFFCEFYKFIYAFSYLGIYFSLLHPVYPPNVALFKGWLCNNWPYG